MLLFAVQSAHSAESLTTGNIIIGVVAAILLVAFAVGFANGPGQEH